MTNLDNTSYDDASELVESAAAALENASHNMARIRHIRVKCMLLHVLGLLGIKSAYEVDVDSMYRDLVNLSYLEDIQASKPTTTSDHAS